MTKLLVRGNEELVTTRFGSIKQFAIAQIGPAQLECRVCRVPGQASPQGHRHSLIEQDFHEEAVSASELVAWSRRHGFRARPETGHVHKANVLFHLAPLAVPALLASPKEATATPFGV